MPIRAEFAFPPGRIVRGNGSFLVQLFATGRGINPNVKYASSLLRLTGYRGRRLLVCMFLVDAPNIQPTGRRARSIAKTSRTNRKNFQRAARDPR